MGSDLMDEHELARLMGISKSDQATSEWATFARNIATAIAVYYRQLLVEGITPEDALKLCENFQPAYLGMLGSMVALQNAMKKGKE